jgi:hypothetical protein
MSLTQGKIEREDRRPLPLDAGKQRRVTGPRLPPAGAALRRRAAVEEW